MKENFEESLREINTAMIENEFVNGGDLPSQTSFVLKRLMKEGVIAKNIPYQMIKLQEEKRSAMSELHEKLQQVDEGGGCTGFANKIPSREILWDIAVDAGIMKIESGKTVPITKGEILTDGEWGISYYLHPEVPRAVKKNYVVSETRRRVFNIVNDQICLNQTGGGEKKDKDLTIRYEKALLCDWEKNIPYGLITEKMVKSFLQKEAIDKNLPIQVFSADVYENVEDKIDFILRVPDLPKGNGNKEGIKTIGVQFTTERREKQKEHKKRHVEEAKKKIHMSSEGIDDIVLVVIPLENTRDIYEKWKNTGKLPGGPEKLWDNMTKELVFRQTLKGIVPNELIDEMWGKVQEKDFEK